MESKLRAQADELDAAEGGVSTVGERLMDAEGDIEKLEALLRSRDGEIRGLRECLNETNAHAASLDRRRAAAVVEAEAQEAESQQVAAERDEALARWRRTEESLGRMHEVQRMYQVRRVKLRFVK